MSISEPRRAPEDGAADRPSTAVAADTNRERTADEIIDRPAESTHGRSEPGPDGAIRDSARGDAGENATRVLPAGNDRPTATAAGDRSTATADRTAADDRPTVVTPTVAPRAERTEEVHSEPRLDLRSVRAREKEQFGGMRFWLAFFGWLTATGLAVLLGAVAAGILAAVGNSNGATSSTTGLQSLGIAGAIVTAVILFVAYYAGGYVAGRMARFSGAQQGVAVWLWGIIITVLAAIAGAIGSQFGLFSQVGSIAQVPINGQTLTVAGIVGVVAALALSLLGAVLGGLGGMRYHRKVDRVAFGA